MGRHWNPYAPFKAAKNLKGTEIYISKDITPLEQAEHRKLVMEVWTISGSSEEEEWLMRHGQVVRRPRTHPKIQAREVPTQEVREKEWFKNPKLDKRKSTIFRW